MFVDLDQMLAKVQYQVRHRVKLDIVGVRAQYKALKPELGTLIHNNGSESLLVHLTGTIPMRYLGNEYHVPIEIYIPEVYPNLAPKIYVRPTPNMIVKPGHKHVDSEGLVYHPYLMGWVGANSTLLELCNILSGVFSADPPLFAKPAAPTPPAATQAVNGFNVYAQHMQQAHANNNNNGSTPYNNSSGSNGFSATPSTANVSSSVITQTTLPRTPSSMQAYYAQLQGKAGTTAIDYGASPAYSSSSTATATATPYTSSASGTPYATATASSVSSSGGAVMAVATPMAANAMYTSNALNNNSAAYTMQSDYKRKELIRKLTSQLQTDLTVRLTTIAGDIDKEMEVQAHLEHTRSVTLRNEQESLRSLQLRCKEKTVLMTEVKPRGLDEWVLSVDPKAKLGTGGDNSPAEAVNAAGGDDDDASVGSEKSKAKSDAGDVAPELDRLVHYDDASVQLVKLLAEQNAIEDAIYSLDHALAYGTNVVDTATFLKRMRELSRRQFLCKLHILKINSVIEQRS